ncbi:hypothetical protein Pelo_9544 [Pelomyxa schiedti]|nr:hypothetical protein Pelo_9544 [Pelomyxa schiedti]
MQRHRTLLVNLCPDPPVDVFVDLSATLGVVGAPRTMEVAYGEHKAWNGLSHVLCRSGSGSWASRLAVLCLEEREMFSDLRHWPTSEWRNLRFTCNDKWVASLEPHSLTIGKYDEGEKSAYLRCGYENSIRCTSASGDQLIILTRGDTCWNVFEVDMEQTYNKKPIAIVRLPSLQTTCNSAPLLFPTPNSGLYASYPRFTDQGALYTLECLSNSLKTDFPPPCLSLLVDDSHLCLGYDQPGGNNNAIDILVYDVTNPGQPCFIHRGVSKGKKINTGEGFLITMERTELGQVRSIELLNALTGACVLKVNQESYSDSAADLLTNHWP